ncbi:MAG TPA: hypothetical protein VFO94_10495 [Gammaproteobacteria bacterium]|nr:hypothetical protein [Gammaproteobacteria bacterium]
MQPPIHRVDPESLAVGDWIKYVDVDGTERITEIHSFHGGHMAGGARAAVTPNGYVSVHYVIERRAPAASPPPRPTVVPLRSRRRSPRGR